MSSIYNLHFSSTFLFMLNFIKNLKYLIKLIIKSSIVLHIQLQLIVINIHVKNNS